MDEKKNSQQTETNENFEYQYLPEPGILGTWTFDPTYNVMFQRVFGQEASSRITPSFVNCLLKAKGMSQLETEDVQISSESALVGSSIECKTPRMDVRIVTPSWRANLEVQRGKEFVGDRMVFYASKLFAESLVAGRDYAKAPRVLVMMLYSYSENVVDSEEFLHLGQLVWDSNSSLVSDKVQLLLVELDKFKKRFSELSEEILHSELLGWLYYLTKGYRKEKERSILEKTFPTLVEFAQLYGLAIDDPKTASLYNAELEAEIDYNSHLSIARMDGHAEGHVEGLAKAMSAVMTKLNIDTEAAFELLDISEGEREKLAKLV